MKISNDVRSILLNIFGIDNIKYRHHTFSVYDTPVAGYQNYMQDVQFESMPVYEATIDERFLDTLIRAIDYDSKHNNGFSEPKGPPIDVLYDYLMYNYNREKNEKYLQDKYPELAEIAKEYEIMKALILKK